MSNGYDTFRSNPARVQSEFGQPNQTDFNGYALTLKHAYIPNKDSYAGWHSHVGMNYGPMTPRFRTLLPQEIFSIKRDQANLLITPGYGYGQSMSVDLQPTYPRYEKWQLE
jgi:hypothetical protein